MHLDGSEYPEYIPYKHNWTPKTLKVKLQNIAEVVCEVDADIIGLQEVENRHALILLQHHLKRYGCPYAYRAITHTPQSAIQVALLSKIPIQKHQDLVVTRARGIRNILEVTLDIEGEPLYVFVNHWNSKRSPNSKRLRSAKRLKARMLQLPKRSPVVVLGDFNLHYTESIMEDTLQGVRPCRIQTDPKVLVNLWFELPIYRRWSHNFYGKKQSLDAILLSSALFDGEGLEYKKGSFHPFKPNYLFHKKGYVLRWRYEKGRHRGEGYSDHLPVVAEISTNQPYTFRHCDPIVGSIEMLHQKEVRLPLLLQHVQVVEKKPKHAVIQQGKYTITLYGLEGSLELGKFYDLVVYQRTRYQGIYEVVDFSIKNSYDTTQKRN